PAATSTSPTGSSCSTSAAGRRCCPIPTNRSSTSTPRARPASSRRNSHVSSECSWTRSSREKPRRSSARSDSLLHPIAKAKVQLHPRPKGPMDPLPDLATLNDEDLKKLIDELTREEQEVSYRRRLLHGKIDILRAELVARLQQTQGRSVLDAVDVESLTEILT